MMADKLRIPAAARAPASAVTDLTDAGCRGHLDEDYRRIVRRLVARLARKRPSPLLRGDARIWAGGVLYAIGRINFLFDPPQQPHRSPARLAAVVGAKHTTMANKASKIDRLLNIGIYEPELTHVAMLEQHPMAWMVEVNGFLVDARRRPEALQEDARRRGLISDLDALRAA